LSARFFHGIFCGYFGYFRRPFLKIGKQAQAIIRSSAYELEKKARSLKADALIGLKMDFDEISGKNKQLFMVTGYATAVRLSQNDASTGQVYGLGARVKDQLLMNRGSAIVNDYLGKYESGDSEDLWKFASIMEQLLSENMRIHPDKLIIMLYYKTKPSKGSVPVLDRDAIDKFTAVLSNSINSNEEIFDLYFALNKQLISSDCHAFSCPENKDIYMTVMSDCLEADFRKIAENLKFFPQCVWDRMFFNLILKGQEDYTDESIEEIDALINALQAPPAFDSKEAHCMNCGGIEFKDGQCASCHTSTQGISPKVTQRLET
jgi:hypothetical protein